MRTAHKSLLSIFALGAAIVLGPTARAADLPKEGKYKGTTSGYGTFKLIPVGKDRALMISEENDLTVTDGFSDHMAWHCFTTGDIIQGVERDHGDCVGTDIAGDQVIQTFTTKPHPADAPSFEASLTTTYGTGKYAGITGTEHDVCEPGEFKAPEGAYFSHCTMDGTYKLP